jgi:hypothetical protein
MPNKIRILTIAGLFVYLSIVVPTAKGNENCSLQTIAGTYVFNERGSSLMTDPASQPFLVPWDLNVKDITTAPIHVRGVFCHRTPGGGEALPKDQRLSRTLSAEGAVESVHHSAEGGPSSTGCLMLVARRFTVPNQKSRCNQLKLGHPQLNGRIVR